VRSREVYEPGTFAKETWSGPSGRGRTLYDRRIAQASNSKVQETSSDFDEAEAYRLASVTRTDIPPRPFAPIRDSVGALRDPDSTKVLVRARPLEGAEFLRGLSIPFDYRSYVLWGYTILACGLRVPTRFRIDTRSPTLLIDPGIWQIDGVLYYPFSPEALDRLGVAPETTRPFSWTSNVPIETVEEPPYLEGQVLQSRLSSRHEVSSIFTASA
jgi:hypothetical protein